jgi:hypothetical protein
MSVVYADPFNAKCGANDIYQVSSGGKKMTGFTSLQLTESQQETLSRYLKYFQKVEALWH